MKVIIEEEINAGYVYLNYELPSKTVEFGSSYLVNVAESGQVTGVEILDLKANDFDALEFSQAFGVDIDYAHEVRVAIIGPR